MDRMVNYMQLDATKLEMFAPQVHVLGGLRVGLTHDIDMMPELVLERRTPEGEILRTSPAYHEDLHEGEGWQRASRTT